MRILIVHDDSVQGGLLKRRLQEEGHSTEHLTTGRDALIAASRPQVSLAIVSVALGQMSGYEVCRRLREAGGTMPILLLGDSATVADRVFGLDSGADDYLCAPFDIAELSARVRALLRRGVTGRGRRLEVGAVVFDTVGQVVTVDGRRVSLSPKEVALFRLLCTRVGSTVDRASILSEVWAGSDTVDPNVVDQYISYLRRKIDPESARVRILTVRGTGYSLQFTPSGNL